VHVLVIILNSGFLQPKREDYYIKSEAKGWQIKESKSSTAAQVWNIKVIIH
jgi:hypothetical protein